MLKTNIRNLFLKKRKLYSDDYVKYNSNLIKNNLFTHFNFNKISLLHTFLPILEKKEVNTFLIIKEIFERYKNIKLIVPVVDFDSNSLLHKYYHNNSLLCKNKYGIMEPKDSELFSELQSIDMILMPLLSFDKKGNRVGYGGGYYDKFISNCLNVKRVGLSFEEPIELITDTNSFDCKLDYCITPQNVYNFK